MRDGFSNRQVATSLHYSVKTVETYLTHIYTKTGCQSRLELARAIDTGRVVLLDLASLVARWRWVVALSAKTPSW